MSTSQSQAKQCIVIIPAAWHTPSHYKPVARILREHGHSVEVVNLPSIGVTKDDGDGLRKDTDAVLECLEALLGQSKDVVIVAHSYGGLPASDAVGALKESGKLSTSGGKISRIVFLNAHIIDKGAVRLDKDDQLHSFITIKDGVMTNPEARERYYNDITPDAAQTAIDMLRPMALSAFTTKVKHAGWKDYGIPCTYILCTRELPRALAKYEEYPRKLKSDGVDTIIVEIDTGHCPMFTEPQLLANTIIGEISSEN